MLETNSGIGALPCSRSIVVFPAGWSADRRTWVEAMSLISPVKCDLAARAAKKQCFVRHRPRRRARYGAMGAGRRRRPNVM